MKNDGGPAFPHFPVDVGNVHLWVQGGMSLRDWFAAMASEADIDEYLPETVGACQKFEEIHGFTPTRQWARYQHADAMLRAREGE